LRQYGYQHHHSHPDGLAGATVLFRRRRIVADSEEAAEYQETFDKVNRILHQLEN
jgi:hypothetical protein